MEEIFIFAKEMDNDTSIAPHALIDDIKEYCNHGKFAQKILFENIVENQKYLIL